MSEFTTFDSGEAINSGISPDFSGSIDPSNPETFFSRAFGPKKKNGESDNTSNRGRGNDGGSSVDWREKHKRPDSGTDAGPYDEGVKRTPEGDEYEDLGYGHVG